MTVPRGMITCALRILLSLTAAVFLYLFTTSLFLPSTEEDASLTHIDTHAIEKQIEDAKKFGYATYEPPNKQGGGESPVGSPGKSSGASHVMSDVERTIRFHKIWTFADSSISIHELFPDTPDVDTVLEAMRIARIVSVELLDLPEADTGTAEKWLVHLEGGQRALMKLAWEEKGQPKKDAQCNFGYEMVHGEIAAFHLHRLLGFRNTPYATGRRVDLRREVFPVASPAVAKQIVYDGNNNTCVVGKCYYCKEPFRLCPHQGVVDASLVYWVPRKMTLYTRAPHFMPWSTTSDQNWKQYGFNNKTYCNLVRSIHPYEIDRYFHDLFDFAAVDTLMYHYDSKHYLVEDRSPAHGLTVRLDHGRAFCAYDKDDEQIFMAPISQCCQIRWATHDALSSLANGILAQKLKEELQRDPLHPVMSDRFYEAINRRHKKLLTIIDKCAQSNGGLENVLVG